MRMRWIGIELLVGLLLAAAGGPGAAEAFTRDEALRELADVRNAETRRLGAAQLAETGVMADVPVLTGALRDADAGVRAEAERALWLVWSRSGDPEVDAMFAEGLRQMQGYGILEAIGTFSDIIQKKPEFAEGWNKRATVFYMLGEYEKSLKDCDEVVKRNPAHFGALSGYGQIYLQLGKLDEALYYFERALAVNPNLAGVEATVEAIKEHLAGRHKSI
jgi:tetratricopeptide (TPR) repeat protein